jgi:hypothetical protein
MSGSNINFYCQEYYPSISAAHQDKFIYFFGDYQIYSWRYYLEKC